MAGGKVLGGLLGLMAAGGLVEDEAEAAAVPGFKKAYVDAFKNNVTDLMHAGSFEPEVFKKIRHEYPDVMNNVSISPHAANSRFDKDGWSAERTADAIVDVLGSNNADIVRNWQKNTGSKSYAKHGVMLPYDANPLFASFFPKNNELVVKTVFEPSENRMGKLGYGVEGGKPFISRFHGNMPAPSTQLQPISAVTPQPSFGTSLGELFAQSKSKLPSIAGAVTGASLGSMPLEAPLESPWFDPVDVLVAPVGVAGAGAKVLAAATAPAWNYLTDNALGGLLGLFQRDGGKQ